jgi:hypothetical protein
MGIVPEKVSVLKLGPFEKASRRIRGMEVGMRRKDVI